MTKVGWLLAQWEVKFTVIVMSQDGASFSLLESHRKKRVLETGAAVSPGGAATAHCSPGCKSHGFPCRGIQPEAWGAACGPEWL